MGKIKPYSITGSEVQPSEVITPATTNTQLASTEMPGLGTISGEIDADDIVIPRVNLVQNVGELADLFPSGAVTYNKEVQLSDGTTPIEVTVLRARKQFVEALDFDSGERPQVFDTLEEVKAVGGTVEWVGNQKPTYTPGSPYAHRVQGSCRAGLRVSSGIQGRVLWLGRLDAPWSGL